MKGESVSNTIRYPKGENKVTIHLTTSANRKAFAEGKPVQ